MIASPIFVADIHGVDLAVFRSVSEAAAFIEPPDVVGKDVVAFDGLGRLLNVALTGKRTCLFPSDGAARDPQLVTRIKTLSNEAALTIDASPEDWEMCIEEAARAIESSGCDGKRLERRPPLDGPERRRPAVHPGVRSLRKARTASKMRTPAGPAAAGAMCPRFVDATTRF